MRPFRHRSLSELRIMILGWPAADVEVWVKAGDTQREGSEIRCRRERYRLTRHSQRRAVAPPEARQADVLPHCRHEALGQRTLDFGTGYRCDSPAGGRKRLRSRLEMSVLPSAQDDVRFETTRMHSR